SQLEADPRFATNADRLEHREQLLSLLEPLFLQRPGDEWIARFREAGVPAGPINTIDRVLGDPQVLHRNMLVELTHPVAGPQKVLGNPIKVGSTEKFLPSPLLGEHTDEVLTSVAGLAADEVAELREQHIV